MARKASYAPAVSYPFRRSPVAALVLAGVIVLGLADILAWVAAGDREMLHLLVDVLFSGLCAFAAWHWWSRQFPGQLLWNSGEWIVHTDTYSSSSESVVLQHPCVHLNVAFGVLLSVRVQGGWLGQRTLWLWLERRYAPERWHALQCALHARAT